MNFQACLVHVWRVLEALFVLLSFFLFFFLGGGQNREFARACLRRCVVFCYFWLRFGWVSLCVFGAVLWHLFGGVWRWSGVSVPFEAGFLDFCLQDVGFCVSSCSYTTNQTPLPRNPPVGSGNLSVLEQYFTLRFA